MVRRPRSTRKAATTAQIARPVPQLDDTDVELDVGENEELPENDEAGALEGDSGGGEDDEGAAASAGEEFDVASRPSTPARRGGPRRRRAGRASRGRAHELDANDESEVKDELSDKGTPKKRGGFRGGPRSSWGGRWARSRAAAANPNQIPLDNEGNMATVKGDEVELPEDPEGETKVDKMGRLTEGREYRVRVFTISGKGDRLYMLSTEPARCIGFRDSYLFFQKHRTLYKVILAEDAKRDLIDRDVIPHSYKGRTIGVVTARSVFREFGARIVIGGKKVVDDYQVAAARANGDVEGELAVPEDRIPSTAGDAYDRNQYVAWHGASNVYHSGQPSVPLQGGKPGDVKKRKVMVTGANWMFEHAREANRFNASLTGSRQRIRQGVYDVHTNMLHFQKSMQPSHVQWMSVPPSKPFSNSRTPAERLAGWPTTNDAVHEESTENHTEFAATASVVARNFMVTDLYYHPPSNPSLGYPGSDAEIWDINPPGLSQVPREVLAELPNENLRAFHEKLQQELEWQGTWREETSDACRSSLRITYNTNP